MNSCPITNTPGVRSVRVSSWSYYLLLVRLRSLDISVSEEGYQTHLQQLGTFWQVFNWLGERTMNLPILGAGRLVLVEFLLLLPLIPLFLVLDLLLRRRLFGRGMIRLNEDGGLIINQ